MTPRGAAGGSGWPRRTGDDRLPCELVVPLRWDDADPAEEADLEAYLGAGSPRGATSRWSTARPARRRRSGGPGGRAGAGAAPRRAVGGPNGKVTNAMTGVEAARHRTWSSSPTTTSATGAPSWPRSSRRCGGRPRRAAERPDPVAVVGVVGERTDAAEPGRRGGLAGNDGLSRATSCWRRVAGRRTCCSRTSRWLVRWRRPAARSCTDPTSWCRVGRPRCGTSCASGCDRPTRRPRARPGGRRGCSCCPRRWPSRAARGCSPARPPAWSGSPKGAGDGPAGDGASRGSPRSPRRCGCWNGACAPGSPSSCGCAAGVRYHGRRVPVAAHSLRTLRLRRTRPVAPRRCPGRARARGRGAALPTHAPRPGAVGRRRPPRPHRLTSSRRLRTARRARAVR